MSNGWYFTNCFFQMFAGILIVSHVSSGAFCFDLETKTDMRLLENLFWETVDDYKYCRTEHYRLVWGYISKHFLLKSYHNSFVQHIPYSFFCSVVFDNIFYLCYLFFCIPSFLLWSEDCNLLPILWNAFQYWSILIILI